MKENKLIKILKTIQLNGKYFNKKTAIYIKSNKYSFDGSIDEFIVLFNKNGSRVGGLYIMGDFDLHFIIFKEFRNKGYLSKFMKSKKLNKIRPTLKKASICNNKEYNKIKHLLKLSGLGIKKDVNDW